MQIGCVLSVRQTIVGAKVAAHAEVRHPLQGLEKSHRTEGIGPQRRIGRINVADSLQAAFLLPVLGKADVAAQPDPGPALRVTLGRSAEEPAAEGWLDRSFETMRVTFRVLLFAAVIAGLAIGVTFEKGVRFHSQYNRG